MSGTRTETFFAIRRTDGELMHGEYGWSGATNQVDWEAAELDSEDCDEPIEYELVKMTIEPIARRRFPLCRSCGETARFWGLCEFHASEDDPEAVDEALAAADSEVRP